MRWVVFGLLWIPSIAEAEVHVIYRKADRQIVAYARPPQTAEQELQNTLQSQAGGVAADYEIVTVAEIPPGHDVRVTADGTLATAPRPAEEAPVEIPLSDFGAGALGGLAAQGFVVMAKRRRGGAT